MLKMRIFVFLVRILTLGRYVLHHKPIHQAVRGIPWMQWHTFPWNTTAVNPQPQHPSALTGMAFSALSALYQVLSSATNTWSFCDCDTMTAPASRSNCPNLLASQLLMLKNLCSDLKRLDITLDGSHDVVWVSLWSYLIYLVLHHSPTPALRKLFLP